MAYKPRLQTVFINIVHHRMNVMKGLVPDKNSITRTSFLFNHRDSHCLAITTRSRTHAYQLVIALESKTHINTIKIVILAALRNDSLALIQVDVQHPPAQTQP